jgi:hypothetical protein
MSFLIHLKQVIVGVAAPEFQPAKFIRLTDKCSELSKAPFIFPLFLVSII